MTLRGRGEPKKRRGQRHYHFDKKMQKKVSELSGFETVRMTAKHLGIKWAHYHEVLDRIPELKEAISQRRYEANTLSHSAIKKLFALPYSTNQVFASIVCKLIELNFRRQEHEEQFYPVAQEVIREANLENGGLEEVLEFSKESFKNGLLGAKEVKELLNTALAINQVEQLLYDAESVNEQEVQEEVHRIDYEYQEQLKQQRLKRIEALKDTING